MQTFLPYSSFAESARVLDYRRLGKQRVECLQIRAALRGDSGWKNHPAVRMWRGAEATLVEYAVAICDEWISRGYKDTCREKLLAVSPITFASPTWLGNEDFHHSHRANLVRKDPQYYVPLFGELPMEPYVWP